jgi:hypothetical protein
MWRLFRTSLLLKKVPILVEAHYPFSAIHYPLPSGVVCKPLLLIRVNCHALQGSAIRSVRPTIWLRQLAKAS